MDLQRPGRVGGAGAPADLSLCTRRLCAAGSVTDAVSHYPLSLCPVSSPRVRLSEDPNPTPFWQPPPRPQSLQAGLRWHRRARRRAPQPCPRSAGGAAASTLRGARPGKCCREAPFPWASGLLGRLCLAARSAGQRCLPAGEGPCPGSYCDSLAGAKAGGAAGPARPRPAICSGLLRASQAHLSAGPGEDRVRTG